MPGLIFEELQGLRINLAAGRPPSAGSLRLARPLSAASTVLSTRSTCVGARTPEAAPPRPAARLTSRGGRTSSEPPSVTPGRSASQDERSVAGSAAEPAVADWSARGRLGSRPISVASSDGRPPRLVRPPLAPDSARSGCGGSGVRCRAGSRDGSASTVASAGDLTPLATAAVASLALVPALALPSPAAAVRGRRAEETLAILNSARSVCSGPCLPDERSPSSPLSPLTALIKRELSKQPAVALVRRVELRRAASKEAPLLAAEPSRTAAQTVRGASEPPRPRAASGEPAQELPRHQRASASSASERGLSEEELHLRAAKMADYFRESCALNRKARCAADHALILEDARRQRAESRERLATERAEADFQRLRMDRLAREAARQGELPPSPAASAPTPTTCSSSCASEAGTVPVKPRSLLEKFGYGVKPKDEERQHPAAIVYVVPTKVNRMMCIKAGSNDLKERLARCKRTVE